MSVAEVVGRFDPEVPIEEAWTPPASWYVAPEIYALERGAVFGRSWQPVARAAQVAEPGQYAAGTVAGAPWLVLRDDGGTLRAFHNVCRHKATPLADGEGCVERLRCPYHGWTYALDGRLTSAPRVAGIRNFDRAALSLVPMQVEIWGPYVFVNADRTAPALGPQLDELTRRLRATSWDGLTFAGRRTYEVACNWKVFVDNYLDGGYHVPTLHPTLDAQLDMESYRTECFGIYSIQSSGAAGVGDGRLDVDPAERIGGGALYAWIYPAFMINRYGPAMDTNLVVPLGPDRTLVLYDFFFAPGADEGFLERSMRQSDVTQREDVAISEAVQRGLRSPAYERGRYAPAVEIGEHHFHRLLAGQLRAELSREEGR